MTYLLIALGLLQLADIVTTLKLLGKGGRELNPFLRWLFEQIGTVPALIAVKSVFMAAVYMARDIPQVEWLMWLLIAFYLLIFWNNMKVIRNV